MLQFLPGFCFFGPTLPTNSGNNRFEPSTIPYGLRLSQRYRRRRLVGVVRGEGAVFEYSWTGCFCCVVRGGACCDCCLPIIPCFPNSTAATLRVFCMSQSIRDLALRHPPTAPSRSPEWPPPPPLLPRVNVGPARRRAAFSEPVNYCLYLSLQLVGCTRLLLYLL